MYSIITFFITPVADIVFTTSSYLTKYWPLPRASADQQKALAKVAREKLPESGRIPNEVATKVNRFIHELDLKEVNPETVVLGSGLLIGNATAASHVFAEMDAPPTPVLYLSRSLILRLRDQELTSEDQFSIAHEVGHIVAQDTTLGEVEKAKIIGSVRLIAYTTSFVALNALSFSLLPSHILACAVANIAGIYPYNVITQRNEKNADLFAARLHSEIARGGISLFMRCRTILLECPKNCCEYMRTFSLVKPHPSFDDRIKAIAPFANLEG